MSESLREKSNKRILVLANNDVGLYRFRKDLLAALLGSGHEVYISLPDGGFISELVQLGCRFIDTPIDRRGMNPARDAKLLGQYRAILKRLRPDLVLTYTIKPNIYGGLACRALHIPYAVNITGLGSAIENGGWLKRFVLTLYKPVLAGAKVVFSKTPETATHLQPPVLSRAGAMLCSMARASIWRITPASPIRRRGRCAFSSSGASCTKRAWTSCLPPQSG